MQERILKKVNTPKRHDHPHFYPCTLDIFMLNILESLCCRGFLEIQNKESTSLRWNMKNFEYVNPVLPIYQSYTVRLLQWSQVIFCDCLHCSALFLNLVFCESSDSWQHDRWFSASCISAVNQSLDNTLNLFSLSGIHFLCDRINMFNKKIS